MRNAQVIMGGLKMFTFSQDRTESIESHIRKADDKFIPNENNILIMSDDSPLEEDLDSFQKAVEKSCIKNISGIITYRTGLRGVGRPNTQKASLIKINANAKWLDGITEKIKSLDLEKL